jgi:alginate O-acetyltransferase complex protein AlgI
MVFDSIEFCVFLPLVFAAYWFSSGRRKLQNLIILTSSYVFYGWWDYRFLLLILFSSFVDFKIALLMQRYNTRRKALLYCSLTANLGLLGCFKYFNFFLDSFKSAFTFFNQPFDGAEVNLILPVGISFYTFQTLSYTLDVYRQRIQPTKEIITFFSYVSFFPQLVAGPIERARNLLPQFLKIREFDKIKATDGCRQALWGLFKKMVIANNCAAMVDPIFQEPQSYGSGILFLGATLFLIQMYADFSGYSDIAIGTARLFGINLSRNFNYPFFSLSVPEYWRRWHISLSTWFRDYVYSALFRSEIRTISSRIINTIILFVLIGFWHGANWTFLFFGFLHGIAFIPYLAWGKTNLYAVSSSISSVYLRSLFHIFLSVKTNIFFILTIIFFRSESLGKSIDYYYALIFNQGSIHQLSVIYKSYYEVLIFISVMVTVEWLQRNKHHGFTLDGINKVIRWGIYFLTTYFILYYKGENINYIYFQF